MTRSLALAAGLLVAVAAFVATATSCSQPDPTVGTLSQNVAQGFAPCSENEIKFMASKHNFMPAFRPCADNSFSAYAWSPTGTHLYFQLVMSPYLMDASRDTKPTIPVPTTTPLGPATWVSDHRLVIPVGPDQTGTRNRLAIYDLEQMSIFHVDTDLQTDVDAMPSGEPTAILVLGELAGRGKSIWKVDTRTGDAAPAFPWLTDPPDTFTYQPALDVVVLGQGETVTLRQGGDGLAIGTWPRATRGSLHKDGRHLMLEHLGDPISIFYQRSWDELSPEAREREQRRAKQFEERLLPGTPTTVQPPTLSWVDLHTGQRHVLSSVYGDHFSWYEPTAHYGSFFLWGFEGKQYKRNVLLGSFTGRFAAIEKGRPHMGVDRMPDGEDPAYKPPTGLIPDDPAAPADARD